MDLKFNQRIYQIQHIYQIPAFPLNQNVLSLLVIGKFSLKYFNVTTNTCYFLYPVQENLIEVWIEFWWNNRLLSQMTRFENMFLELRALWKNTRNILLRYLHYPRISAWYKNNFCTILFHEIPTSPNCSERSFSPTETEYVFSAHIYTYNHNNATVSAYYLLIILRRQYLLVTYILISPSFVFNKVLGK